MTFDDLIETPGPTFPEHDHRIQSTCTCVGRHIDEAIRAFDKSEALLERAKGLPEDDDACNVLTLLHDAAVLRLTGIREARAAHLGLHATFVASASPLPG